MRIVDCRLAIVDGKAAGFAVAVASLFFASCTQEQSSQRTSSGTPVTKVAEDGPIKLSLTVQPAELPFNQNASLTVEAVADKGVVVDLSDYAARVEEDGRQFEYRLRRTSQSSASPTPDGRLRWHQHYHIEFFLPGEYQLPGAALTYTASENMDSTGDQRAAVTLATEAVTIKALPTDAAQLEPQQLTQIETLPPVELAEPWSKWWLAAIPAGLLLAAVAALLVRRRRKEIQAAAEIIPAHEWARRQIAALIAADLINKGLVQEFYYRISGIVRGYIERRYAVSAPEMTTEEFLSATAGDFRFASEAGGELQDFLTACDLVKYARHRPAAGEWNDLLRTATRFVERTRQDAERSTGQAAQPAGTVP